MNDDLLLRKIELLKDEMKFREQEYEKMYSDRSNCSIFPRKTKKWRINNKRLYRLLAENNLTLHKFAYIIGVNKRNAQRWLFGSLIPNYENRLKIELLFGEDVFAEWL